MRHLEPFSQLAKLSCHHLVVLAGHMGEEVVSPRQRLEVHQGLQKDIQGARIKFHSFAPHLGLSGIGTLRVISISVKLHH